MTEANRRLEILESLKSTTCNCGATKKAMQSHCSKCYFKLDKVLRASLYQPFGSGYEEAFERSLKLLAKDSLTQLFVNGEMRCGDGSSPSWQCMRCNREFCNDGSYPEKCPTCDQGAV